MVRITHGKYLILANQHCISYNVDLLLLHDPALQFAISFKELTPTKRKNVIKRCLSIYKIELNITVEIREIVITNQTIFINKNISY